MGPRGGLEAGSTAKKDFGHWQGCRDLDRGRCPATGGPGCRGPEILESWDMKKFTRVR